MPKIITRDNIADYLQDGALILPADAVVTTEAQAWAAQQGYTLPKPDPSQDPQRAVVSVLGKDRVGIIAGVANVLADHNVNILDISQTTMQGFFTMIMLVDIKGCTISFAALNKRLAERGHELGVRISAQREEVFHYMHRI
ncbi:MAG TPA: ACT domain-containing protein [Firmicutes bacterium]|jgi:ACT domain-containing protein|nr:ACT domain-containing protein [Bacillota bacterium]